MAEWMMITKDEDAILLRNVVAAFIRGSMLISPQELVALQEPPWSSLADGAAGPAYALLRVAGASPGADAIRRCVGEWIDHLMVGCRKDRTAFDFTGMPKSRFGDTTFFGSKDGLRHVRMLLSHSRGRNHRFREDRDAFLGRCLAGSHRPTELMGGMAGHLCALSNVLGLARSTRSIGMASELVVDIALHEVSAPVGFPVTFAHGRAGILYSLSRWAEVTGNDLPHSAAEALSRMADEIGKVGHAIALRDIPPTFSRSWCKGSAGLVILWVKAYEVTGCDRYLGLAHDAAEFTWGPDFQEELTGPSNLCCGMGGRAYAMLAMHRVDPCGDWRDRAVTLAARAIRYGVPLSGYWSKGLFRGPSGLVCLAQDALDANAGSAGFPLIETA